MDFICSCHGCSDLYRQWWQAMKQRIINFMLDGLCLLIWFAVLGGIFFALFPLFKTDSLFVLVQAQQPTCFVELHKARETALYQGVVR